MRALKLVVRATLPVVALVIGIGVFAWLRATNPSAPQVPEAEAVRQVEVIRAQRLPVARPWRGYGTVRALRESEVAAMVGGPVVERPARIEAGAPVRAGELLIQIDPADYETTVARLESAVSSLEAQVRSVDVEEESVGELLTLAERATELTERELERARQAAERGAAVELEIERLQRQVTITKREERQLREREELLEPRRTSLEGELASARANLRQASLDLERTAVRAPFDGTIQFVNVREGERVAPGEVVARVVDLGMVEIPLRLPASAGGDIRLGDSATLTPDGPEARTWRGSIARISPEADASTRTITAFVEVTQDAAGEQWSLLRPGRFVMAMVRSARAHDEFVAPRRAIDGDRVLVVNGEGRAEARAVEVLYYLDGSFPTLDPEETQWAVVTGGLETGDSVIVSNLDDLRPGARIDAVDAASPTARGGDGERPS